MVLGIVPGTAWAVTGDFTVKNGILTKYNGSGGNVVIPQGITSIGYIAFSCCSRLTNITIPSSVTNIGQSAFYGCNGLTSVTILGSNTHIDDYAFSN